MWPTVIVSCKGVLPNCGKQKYNLSNLYIAWQKRDLKEQTAIMSNLILKRISTAQHNTCQNVDINQNREVL